MQVILNFGVLLILLLTAFGFAGVFLVEKHKLHLKTGPRYSRVAATIILGIAYWVIQNTKSFAGVTGWNLVALLGFLWVLCFYLVWGAVAHQLNKHAHRAPGDHGTMLSMLYSDSDLQKARELAKQTGASPLEPERNAPRKH